MNGKVILSLLLIVFSLNGCIADPALAQDLVFFNAVSLPQAQSIAMGGSRLYVGTNEGLYAYEMGQTEPEKLDLPLDIERADLGIGTLLVTGDALWILQVDQGWLGRYQHGTVADKLQLDEAQWNPEMVAETRYGYPLLTEEALFVLSWPRDGSTGQGTILRFDRSRGKTERIAGPGVLEIAAYQPGTLLVLRRQTEMSSSAPYELVVLDAKRGVLVQKIADLPGRDDGHMAYDSQTDTLYAVVGGMLSRLQDGRWQSLRYIPLSSTPMDVSFSAMLHGALYVAGGYGGVYIWEATEAHEAGAPIEVTGVTNFDGHELAYAAQHPDTPVLKTTVSHLCAEEMAVALQTGDDSVDLYLVEMHAGLQALMEKGYLADLSGSSMLMADFAALYPAIAQAVSWEGGLYAVAVTIWLQAWGTRPDLFNDLNIALPQTIPALLDLAESWNWPENLPLVTWGYDAKAWQREDYLAWVFDQYVMTYGQADQPLSFDTSDFRDAVTRVAAFPVSEEGRQFAPGTPALDINKDSGLLNAGLSLSLSGHRQVLVSFIPPPRFSEAHAFQVPATVQVLALNPHSKNKAAAMSYMTYVAGNRSAAVQTLLHQSLQSPVLSREAQGMLDEIDEAMGDLNQQLQASSPEAGRRLIQDSIDELARQKAEIEKAPSSWAVYGPSLEVYRGLAPYMALQLHPLLQTSTTSHAGLRDELLGMLRRTLDGQLTLDECIAQMDMRMRRMFDEQLMDLP